MQSARWKSQLPAHQLREVFEAPSVRALAAMVEANRKL